MRKIIYSIPGYISAIDDNGKPFQAEVEATVETDYSDTALKLAKENSVDGKYSITDLESEEAEPTAQEDTEAMLIDHEYRLTLLEMERAGSEV